MANLRLTDISLAASTAITPTTLIHVVTTADTSQYSGGSSYAGTLGQIYDGLSGYCVSDLYVSNIHSCSPLYINPLSEGDVYVGSANTVTIDLSNERVGIGTTTPTAKLHVKGVDDGVTLAALIQNSGSTNLLSIADNGKIEIGLGAVSTPTPGFEETNVTIGNGAQTVGSRGVAIGNLAQTTNVGQGVSIGHNTSTNDRGVAIAYGAQSSGTSVAIGESSVSSGNGVALGYNAASLGFVSIGYNSSNTGGGILSLGDTTESSGSSSISIGFRVQSTASEAYTIGRSINNSNYLTNNVASSFGIGWSENTPSVLFAKTANQYINGTGNLGIGTTTPSEKLDVSGKTKTINLQVTSGATNGYVLTSDASGNATWQNKDPYLEYRALITQTGTSAPSESILVNTLTGGTWSYTTVGSYYFSKTGAFSASSKVEVYMNNTIVLSYTMSNAAFNIYSINRLDDDNIEVRTSTWTTDATTGTLLVAPPGATVNDAMSNDLLYNSLVSIRVWL